MLSLACFLRPVSAVATGEPLLVVVEAAADVASADEIRADAAAELGSSVVGPADLDGRTGAELLIVEVDTRSAVLACQPRDGPVGVSSAMAASPPWMLELSANGCSVNQALHTRFVLEPRQSLAHETLAPLSHVSSR